MARGSLCIPYALILLIAVTLSPYSAYAADSDVPDPLVQLLMHKGVLTAEDAASLSSVPDSQQHQALLVLLRDKGVISTTESRH
jgi:hypothetical protein